MGRTAEAVDSLVGFLDTFPTDAESWSELAALYVSINLYNQAIFCLEEILLILPYAYNIHARIGEIYLLHLSSPAKALPYFARSVELCDGYPRGLVGMLRCGDSKTTGWARERLARLPGGEAIAKTVAGGGGEGLVVG